MTRDGVTSYTKSRDTVVNQVAKILMHQKLSNVINVQQCDELDVVN